MTAPIRTMPEKIITQMFRQRYHALRANCRVKSWRLTEQQAYLLADEIGWGLNLLASAIEMVEMMKRGEVTVLGAPVSVRPTPPIVVDSATWTGR